jgi:hypothetical protein
MIKGLGWMFLVLGEGMLVGSFIFPPAWTPKPSPAEWFTIILLLNIVGALGGVIIAIVEHQERIEKVIGHE